MKTLDIPEYYHAMSLYTLAKIRLAEVQMYEKELSKLLSDKVGKAGDGIYDSSKPPTREGFEELLREMNVDINWKK